MEALEVSMLTSVLNILSGDLKNDWATRIVCAKAILVELVKHAEISPKQAPALALDNDLDSGAAEAQADLIGVKGG